MTFSLVNPTGWTTGDLLTEDQINQLDQDHAQAVDSSGGLYFLSSPLTFSGDDVNVVGTFGVTGDIEVSDDINCSGNGNFSIGINVNGNFFVDSIGQTIADGLIIANNGILTSTSGTTIINNQSTFNEDLTASATCTASFYGPVFINNGITIENAGTTEVQNPANFYNATTFYDPVTFGENASFSNGSCQILRTYYLNSASLPASQNVENYDQILITSAYTGGGIWTWNDTSAPNGKKMIFVTQSSSAAATISIGSFGFALRNTTGTTGSNANMKRVEIIKVAGSWVIFDSLVA